MLNILGSRSSDQPDAREHDTTGQHNTFGSLPIMSLDYETEETLMSHLYRSAKARLFLQWTANYWPDSNQGEAGDHYHKAYYITCTGALVVVYLLMIVSVVINTVQYQLAPILVAVTVGLDILSALPAQYLNQQRMRHKAFQLEASVIDESMRIATYFGVCCLVTVVLSLVVLVAGRQVSSYYYSNLLTLSIAQVLISLYLSFNMLFLMMDLKVSSLLVDQPAVGQADAYCGEI